MSPSPVQPSAPGHPPIAVVGMGCLLPNAPGLKEYWRLIRRSEDAIREVPPSHWPLADYYDADPKSPDRVYCRRGSFLSPTPFDPFEFGIPPATLEATDTAQLLALVVGKKALQDAGYGPEREFDRTRASVILGVTGTLELVLPLATRLGHPTWRRALEEAGVAPEVAQQVVQQISDSYVGWQESSFPGLLGNVVAGRVANRLDLQGTNCVVDAACASSLSAAHLAVLELAAGRADLVLTGGVDTLNDIFMFMCFAKSQALSPTGDARPFSEDADGTVIGEGVGMLVLKRLTDAQRDGDRVYAVIRGIGTASDGRSQSIYAPRAEGQALALRDAYRVSGVSPATVELLEAHGTGTKVGDLVEMEALRTVYRQAEPTGRWCALGSVKSQIGHTKAAAGVASLIKAILALHHQVLPATTKVGKPHPKLGLEDSPFYLSTQTRPWLANPEHPRRAAVSAFGFGGSNFHAVLEEYPTTQRAPAWDGSVQIVALSASTLDELKALLACWQQAAADGLEPDELARRAADARQDFCPTDACRIALIVEYGTDLAKLLAAAQDGLARNGDQRAWSLDNVFFGGSAEPGELALLFPGQGSQYVGMGRDIVCVFPEARAAVEAANQPLANGACLGERLYPPPVFDVQQRAAQEAALTQTDVAQPALGAVSQAMLRVLERFGIRPRFVAGHSFGELVALHAAGCIDEDALRELSRLRGELMAAGQVDGAMLAVHAPLEEVDRLLAEHGFEVEFANRNSPTQGVLSGSRAALERVAEFLDAQGWRTRLLQVSAAFHSKFMAEARQTFRAALDKIPFASGRIPVFANCTGQPYPLSPAGIRDLLADQLTRPVLFVDEIKNLYDAGVRTFVEVGPKKVLTGLVHGILHGKPYHAIATDAWCGCGSGIVDVARVVALLTIIGHSVDLTKWEHVPPPAARPGMSVALLGANYRAPRPACGPDRPAAYAPVHPGKTAMHETAQPGAGLKSLPPTAADHVGMPQPPNLLPPAPSAPGGADHLARALAVVQDGLRHMQALQQQTAATHQRFLEGQEKAHEALAQLVQSHQRLVERAFGLPGGAVPAAPAFPPRGDPWADLALTPRPESAKPAVECEPGRVGLEVPSPIPIAPPSAPDAAPIGTRGSAGGGNGDAEALASALLAVVSETTGYPVDSIHLDMDLEADLGIDLVRRVDVLSTLRARLPSLLPLVTERAERFRTLREIVECAHNGPRAKAASVPAASKVPTAVGGNGDQPATGPEPRQHERVLLEVVAELTGYPVDMLNLDMDLEADLGIDSIKRLEILSAVQRRLPELNAIDSQYMGSLRTLRNILEYMSVPGGAQPTATPKPPAASAPAPAAATKAATRTADTTTPSPGAVELARRVLTAVELPAAGRGGLCIAPDHEIWITDDGSPLCRALAQRLIEAGGHARVVSPDEPGAPQHDQPVGGLIILAPPIAAEEQLIGEHSVRMLKAAFALTKTVSADLRRAAQRGGALLATISRLDGAFGLAGGPFDAVQGGLAGLAKTAADEWPEVRCRALDAACDWGDAPVVSAAIVAELGAEGPIEVGLSPTGRRGLELSPRSAGAGPCSLEPGDVVVVTGGARGVTAEAVLALARFCQPTLILLGRSAEPEPEPAWSAGIEGEAELKRALRQHAPDGQRFSPAELERSYRRLATEREIRRNLERFSTTGVRVMYRAVDVCDAAAVATVLEEVRQSVGPIRGIIHGAGVIEDRRIEEKAADAFARVLDTKVRGLAALLAATQADDLKCCVLFSSVSGRFGRRGQVDYAMANEVLNKTAWRIAALRPTCRVAAVNWGPWDGGMVSPALKRELMRLGAQLIPLPAGAQALVDELCAADRRAVEVVIGGSHGELLGPRPLTGIPGSDAAVWEPHMGVRRSDRAPAQPPAELTVTLERRLDVERHPFLNSHVIGGYPVLPVVMMLEWLGQGALHEHPGLVLHGLDDFRVLKGLILRDGPPDLRVLASKASKRGEQREVLVELRSGARSNESLHARARALLSDRLPAAPVEQADASLAEEPYGLDVARAYAEVLFHGPLFQGLEHIVGHSRRGMIARARAAPPPQTWMVDPPRTEWLADPLVLDAGLQLGLLWCHAHLGAVGLPCRIGHYRQYQPAFPRDGLTVVLEVRQSDAQRLIADVTFADDGHRIIARLEGGEWTVDASLNEACRPAAVAGV